MRIFLIRHLRISEMDRYVRPKFIFDIFWWIIAASAARNAPTMMNFDILNYWTNLKCFPWNFSTRFLNFPGLWQVINKEVDFITKLFCRKVINLDNHICYTYTLSMNYVLTPRINSPWWIDRITELKL